MFLCWQLYHSFPASQWLSAPTVCCPCCVPRCRCTSVGLLIPQTFARRRPNSYMTILRMLGKGENFLRNSNCNLICLVIPARMTNLPLMLHPLSSLPERYSFWFGHLLLQASWLHLNPASYEKGTFLTKCENWFYKILVSNASALPLKLMLVYICSLPYLSNLICLLFVLCFLFPFLFSSTILNPEFHSGLHSSTTLLFLCNIDRISGPWPQ